MKQIPCSLKKKKKVYMLYFFLSILLFVSLLERQNSIETIKAEETITYETLMKQVTTGTGSSLFPYQVNNTNKTIKEITEKVWNSIKNKKEVWLLKQKNVTWSFDGSKMQESKSFSMPLNLEISKNNNDILLQIGQDSEEEIPGRVSVTVEVSSYFSNGDIVSIASKTDTDNKTQSVVEEGTVTFELSKLGSYLIKSTDQTVKSIKKGEITSIEDNNGSAYEKEAYKGEERGTKDSPLTIIGSLTDEFKASWKAMNVVAGYSGDLYPTADSYQSGRVMYVRIEDRDNGTGHLNASMDIDGSKWALTTESKKGPYLLNYKINPDKSAITDALKDHSLYTGKNANRFDLAEKLLELYTEDEDTQLFYVSRTREFAGPLLLKLDVSKYFNSGDKINIQYVLGSSNGKLYHSSVPDNEVLLTEEATYSKYDCQAVVDYQGYLTFELYNGGFFTFSKSGTKRPQLQEEVTVTKPPRKTEETETDAENKNQEDSEEEKETKSTEKTKATTVPQITDAWKNTDEAVNPLEEKQTSKKNTGNSNATTKHKSQSNKKEKNSEEKQDEEQAINSATDEIMKGKTLKEEMESDTNYALVLKDNNVTVKGNITKEGLTLAAKKITEKSAIKKIEERSGKKICDIYEITLFDKDGKEYLLKDNENLSITIQLGSGYTVMDIDKLAVRHSKNDGTLDTEIFNSKKKLNEQGEMILTFSTTHLSTFVILREEAKESRIVRPEYNAQNASNLSNPLEEKANMKPPLWLLLCFTGVCLIPASIWKSRKGALDYE